MLVLAATVRTDEKPEIGTLVGFTGPLNPACWIAELKLDWVGSQQATWDQRLNKVLLSLKTLLPERLGLEFMLVSLSLKFVNSE